jgi:hypothetical protein
MSTSVKLNRTPQWQYLSRIKSCPPTSGSSINTKNEYSCVPWAPRSYASPTNSSSSTSA